MVDDVLAATGRLQSRVRLLPARVVMYLLLAACLFGDLGYRQVWSRLTAALHELPITSPTGSALRQARQRLGPAPMRALFDLLRGPAVTSAAQVRWRGLLLTVVDGTMLVVADSPANTRRFTKHRCTNGSSGYPQLRLSALLTCGTRSLVDAVFDPVSVGEIDQARALVRNLQPGMLLLGDRNYAAADPLTTIAETGAHLLIRAKANRKLAITRRLNDGVLAVSYRRSEHPSRRSPDRDHHHRRHPHRRLPATHHAARPRTLSRRRTGPALPRTLGDRDRLPRTQNPASSAAAYSVPAPPTASTKRSTRSWSPTSSCASPWSTPPTADPASIPTGPASPPPSTPPATNSCTPPVSSPAPSSTSSAPSVPTSSPTCYPTAGPG